MTVNALSLPHIPEKIVNFRSNFCIMYRLIRRPGKGLFPLATLREDVETFVQLYSNLVHWWPGRSALPWWCPHGRTRRSAPNI